METNHNAINLAQHNENKSQHNDICITHRDQATMQYI